MYYAKYYLNNEGIASLLMTIPTLLSFLMAFIIPALAKENRKTKLYTVRRTGDHRRETFWF